METTCSAAIVLSLVGLLAAACGGTASTRPVHSSARSGRASEQVYVCRNPFYAAQAFGGEQCYGNEADVGTAAVAKPKALMCETSLTGVNRKVIGIQVVYEGRRIVNWHARAHSRSAEPFVSFDRSGIITGFPGDDGTGLSPGRYRCQFLVNGKVARARTITVS